MRRNLKCLVAAFVVWFSGFLFYFTINGEHDNTKVSASFLRHQISPKDVLLSPSFMVRSPQLAGKVQSESAKATQIALVGMALSRNATTNY